MGVKFVLRWSESDYYLKSILKPVSRSKNALFGKLDAVLEPGKRDESLMMKVVDS